MGISRSSFVCLIYILLGVPITTLETDALGSSLLTGFRQHRLPSLVRTMVPKELLLRCDFLGSELTTLVRRLWVCELCRILSLEVLPVVARTFAVRWMVLCLTLSRLSPSTPYSFCSGKGYELDVVCV